MNKRSGDGERIDGKEEADARPYRRKTRRVV
jgi:hypothetical protein